jgi:hypothetical protein
MELQGTMSDNDITATIDRFKEAENEIRIP